MIEIAHTLDRYSSVLVTCGRKSSPTLNIRCMPDIHGLVLFLFKTFAVFIGI